VLIVINITVAAVTIGFVVVVVVELFLDVRLLDEFLLPGVDI